MCWNFCDCVLDPSLTDRGTSKEFGNDVLHRKTTQNQIFRTNSIKFTKILTRLQGKFPCRAIRRC